MIYLFDCVVEVYGQICYEVLVGFKWVLFKMVEINVVIGGEFFGGLIVQGYIVGKDGVYVGILLVEMIVKWGKKFLQIYVDIEECYGWLEMVEDDFFFVFEDKEYFKRCIYQDKDLFDFGLEVDYISDMDGVKVYFVNGGWIIVWFFGIEFFLWVFCEMFVVQMVCECIDKVVKYYYFE